jgi:hypothetical protein
MRRSRHHRDQARRRVPFFRSVAGFTEFDSICNEVRNEQVRQFEIYNALVVWGYEI